MIITEKTKRDEMVKKVEDLEIFFGHSHISLCAGSISPLVLNEILCQ
jgi:hypothetical protein